MGQGETWRARQGKRAAKGRRRLTGACLGGLLSLGTPDPAEAGSFLRRPGSSELILGITLGTFSRAYDQGGRLRRAAIFDKGDVTLHAERGYHDRLTLVAVLHNDQLRPRILNTPGWFSTWGAMVGGRVPLWRGASGAIVSVQALAGLGGAEGARGFEGEARLGAGIPWSWAGRDGFVDMQMGHRFRPAPAASEWRLDGTIGLNVLPRWLLMAQVFAAAASDQAGQAWRVKGQIATVWHINATWSVQASVFRTLAGRLTPAEWGGSLALWWRF